MFHEELQEPAMIYDATGDLIEVSESRKPKEPSSPKFNLDRTFTMGVVLALAIQLGGTVFAFGEYVSRLSHVEENAAATSARMDEFEHGSVAVLERRAQLEAHATDQTDMLKSMDQKLDRLESRGQ